MTAEVRERTIADVREADVIQSPVQVGRQSNSECGFPRPRFTMQQVSTPVRNPAIRVPLLRGEETLGVPDGIPTDSVRQTHRRHWTTCDLGLGEAKPTLHEHLHHPLAHILLCCLL